MTHPDGPTRENLKSGVAFAACVHMRISNAYLLPVSPGSFRSGSAVNVVPVLPLFRLVSLDLATNMSSSSSPSEGDGLDDGLVEALGLVDALGLTDGLTLGETDGLTLALADGEGDAELDGLRLADGETLGDVLELGDVLADGLTDADAEPVGDGDADVEALGDTLPDGLTL